MGKPRVAKVVNCAVVPKFIAAQNWVRASSPPGSMGSAMPSRLFVGGTGALADAVAECADTSVVDFETGDALPAYLRSRGLLGSRQCHLPDGAELTIGEDFATSRGVDVRRVKQGLFLVTSLMVGGIVSVCGPIGFVGMVCPHICRLLLGPNHRRLAPRVFLAGGLFLVLCDTAARTLVAPAEIPVGVITALLGGLFFLWLLFRRPTPRQ